MDEVIQNAIGTVFDSALGKDSVYQPVGGGDSSDLRVVFREGHDIERVYGAQIVASATVIEARQSDIPAPAKGDTFTIDGVDYTVKSQPLRGDDAGLTWRMEIVEA